MPLVDLSHDELKRAALSARAQAFRHEQQAKDGPDPAEPHLEQAKRYREQWAADNPAWGFAIDCTPCVNADVLLPKKLLRTRPDLRPPI
jgi:hypothetical protein